jgi:hypothetical protein
VGFLFLGFHRLSLGYRAGYSLDTGAKPEIGDKIHTEQDTICIKVQCLIQNCKQICTIPHTEQDNSLYTCTVPDTEHEKS